MEIETDPIELCKLSLGELYTLVKYVQTTIQPHSNFTKQLALIQQGDTGINIHHLTHEYYEEYPDAKKVGIYGYKKIAMETFYEDLENRKSKAIQLIIDYAPDEETYRGRELED